MAPCKNNPECKNQSCPQNKKSIKITEDPDNIAKKTPSWNFSLSDQDGVWAFRKENIGNGFWDKILDKLISFEKMTWGDIESDKNNHFVSISGCNKCARDRLEVLKITEDRLFSLRLEGKIRIYGIRKKSALFILWYDTDHGDNCTCVFRSRKKS